MFHVFYLLVSLQYQLPHSRPSLSLPISATVECTRSWNGPILLQQAHIPCICFVLS